MINPEISQFLERLGIANHPGLRVDEKLEGYRDFTFGCRAGPVKGNVMDLAHDLAHAAQFGARFFNYRASDRGFRFKVRRIWVYDRYCDEPRSNQATLRELDTFAYQLHLLELAGLSPKHEEFMHKSARLMRFMHDWWLIPGDSEEARATWCSGKIREYYGRRKPQTVHRRLTQWLDATHERLANAGL